ncbi:MAG: family efflux transporter permease subunit [Patescibacteria group bacterium]|nr:family efflux transporter permease subunit [Patescibacteria group bacterium]
MLPLSLFRSRDFTGANLATLGMYAALGGAIFSIILYLQTAVGYSPLATGLAFLPTTLIMFFFASRAGKLSAIYGPRLFMTLGPIIAALGFLLLLRVSPGHHDYILDLLPGILVFSAGLALTVAPLTTTVITSVDNNRSGIASAANNAVARLAGLFIVAFLGIIVATETTNSLKLLSHDISNQTKTTIQQAIAAGLKPAQLSSIPSQDQPAVQTAVTKAQRSIFVDAILINAALAFFAGLISFALVQNKKPKRLQS